jgi:hypothetical protein
MPTYGYFAVYKDTSQFLYFFWQWQARTKIYLFLFANATDSFPSVYFFTCLWNRFPHPPPLYSTARWPIIRPQNSKQVGGKGQNLGNFASKKVTDSEMRPKFPLVLKKKGSKLIQQLIQKKLAIHFISYFIFTVITLPCYLFWGGEVCWLCSETMLTGKSRFHISTPLEIWTCDPCGGKQTG